ncbi:C2H2-type zinc finger protein [Hemibagrus wyckioides]|uniref:C2H2-type zinc finger protein n=1 Tax=Hemibagrus wyckioides TaxID=337641 RepID=UPI00266C7094|nr:C2H2-type zinc finger protein [Hemibagrus wyckioides]
MMEDGVSRQEDTKDPLLLPSLRLLVPPVRLMSAVLWRAVQQQDVMQYGMLADFVSLVTEAVPELCSPTHAVQLVLGLRAKLILELCYREETVDTHLIQPHLNSIQLVLPLVKHVDSTELEETGVHFVELVQTLIKDADQREHFFQNVFPVEFGPSYDSALQTLMWDFLSRLEHFLPVPDLLQTVAWLRSESSALKDCEESISNPDSLRSLLHHHRCLGHLDTCASSLLPRVGDCILTALSGKRNQGSQMNSGLNPPPHTEMPMCVMDGTDVETVVVTSEWTEIEIHANQQTREDNSEDGVDSPPATDCDQSESRSHRNTEESEIQPGKHTDSENCFRESALMYNKHDESVGCTQDRTAETVQLECTAKERQSLTCSTTPPLDSTLTVPVNAADGAAAFTIPTGTRRSARKPKKTWKLRLVNLQKQKRKPGVVTRQKQERTPLSPMRNSERVTEIYGECITSDNGDVAELSVSPGLATSDGNTELSSKTFSCPHCPFTHIQERYVKSHMKKVHPVSSSTEKEPHVCQVCGKGYRYPGMLKAHERSHTGEQPFQCTASHCGRRFSYIQALRRHRLVHSLKKNPQTPADESLQEAQEAELEKDEPQNGEPWMYTCLYCSESFSSLSARREHHKTHPEDDLKRCNDCGKRLSCQAALIRHKRGHMGDRPHKCLLCGSCFVCTTSFKRHMLVHQPERPYRCSCGKGFTYKGALLSHQRTHTAERRYRCSRCNRCFLYPGELRKHERTHSDEKPYLCPHCGKSFKRERILRAHVAGHTEDKIFKCSLCNKTFAYKASLTRHELTHTGERPFLCSDCGKTFFSFGELLKHQRYHTGIKPFQCSHCDKSFTQACYLQLHTRYHTGVRPYTCPQCSKSFFTSCRLKRHMQIHTDEKPFECTECGKRFRQAYVLKVHRRTHLEKELRV